VLTRRSLAHGAWAAGALAAAPRFLVRAADAAPGRRKVLVAVFQRGAVDGIAMVPPHGDPVHASLRPSIGIPPPRPGDAAAAVDLDGFFGLHPALADLTPLWRDRALAVVHACGSPDATRSHFDAQDYMETGTPGVKSTPDGWLARVARALPPPGSPFRAVALGGPLPRSLRGDVGALSISSLARFDVRAGADGAAARRGFESLYEEGVRDLLHGTGRETFEAVKMLQGARAATIPVDHGADYPFLPLGGALKQIAQLIKADVGLEVAFADIPGWDTHVAQGAEQGRLASRLRELGSALAAFAQDLGDRMADVVVMTMSEFGRTVAENGNRGTDHGHATAMLVMGGGIRGGVVYGRWPGLSAAQRFEGRDLVVTTDFRTLFTEVATRHLAVPAAPLFPGFIAPPGRLGILG
jgi:uncharacterized protein (DUF1501 family)